MRKNFSKMARLASNLRFSCLDIKNDEIGVLTPRPVLSEFLKSVEYRKIYPCFTNKWYLRKIPKINNTSCHHSSVTVTKMNLHALTITNVFKVATYIILTNIL